MKAFVFVDRLGSEIAPLNSEYCVAMLPVAGKPVLAYTIDEMARSGVHEAVIVACHGAREVADYFGCGERWGMQFEYFPSRGEESAAQLLTRYGRLPEEPFLVLRGDVLRSGTTEFLEKASVLSGNMIMSRIGGADVGLCLCRDRDTLQALSLPFTGAVAVEGRTSVELEGAAYGALESIPALHRAILELASGRFVGFSLAGWEHRPGVVIGPGSHLEEAAIQSQHSYIGRSCRVHRKAELVGSVVIDDESFIDRGACIENSVILPATYVGENLHVNNALVCGQQVFRVDSGACYTVTDPFLLSTMKTGALRTQLKRLGNRLCGLLALIISLPLWLLAALSALSNLPEKPLGSRLYYSNKRCFEPGIGWRDRTFTGWHWQVNTPVLHSLPMLLSVIAGHIDLWGVRPRPVGGEDADLARWQQTGKLMSSGLLGPVQLLLPLDAPPEERMLSEIQYSYQNTAAQHLFYLRRAFISLFTARAWRALPAQAEELSARAQR